MEPSAANFSCAVQQHGDLQIKAGSQQGSFKPWWSQYRLEVFGWVSRQHMATADHTYPLAAASSA